MFRDWRLCFYCAFKLLIIIIQAEKSILAETTISSIDDDQEDFIGFDGKNNM